MKPIQMVDLYGQYLRIKSEIDAAMQQVIKSTAFIKGPFVRDFEQHYAEYLQVNQVVTAGNCTDALQMALMAIEPNRGDEVIVPSFTFISSAEVIALLGLKPVFADVDEATFNIRPEEISKAITPRTKAVIPVHLYGQGADMESIVQIARDNGLYIIEDAAQAAGARYTFSNGSTQRVGTIGDVGCTSFFPSKNLGTYGDGGAAFSNNETLADTIRVIANHGSHQKYYHKKVGVNSRLDGLHAAILDVKLQYLEAYNQARQKAAARYDALLADVPGITLPVRSKASEHLFHQYTIQVHNGGRDALKAYLKEQGIPTIVYYPVPMHQQEAFRQFAGKDACPVSERLSKSVLSLPMHTELTEEQQTYIAEEVRRFFSD